MDMGFGLSYHPEAAPSWTGGMPPPKEAVGKRCQANAQPVTVTVPGDVCDNRLPASSVLPTFLRSASSLGDEIYSPSHHHAHRKAQQTNHVSLAKQKGPK